MALFKAGMLLRSPLGRVLSRWLDTGPPGLEIRLEADDGNPRFLARSGVRRFILEVRNRGRKRATLTELGLLNSQGEQQPLESPELILKPGAVLRLRVEMPVPLGFHGRRGQDHPIRAYAVDRGRWHFRSA